MADYSGQKNIDFTPLKNLHSPPDSPIWVYLSYLIIWMIITAYPLAILQNGALFKLSFLVGIGLAGGLYCYNRRRHQKSEVLLQNFAVTNGFQYDASQKLDKIDNTGTLFNDGIPVKSNDIVTGKLADLPFCLFGYNYKVPQGKSDAYYDAAVMEITLPRKLPHMVIDCLVEKGNHDGSTLPINFAASQRLELEGDFYKYFSLYAPDDYAVSALTIIAPDAMQVLMASEDYCDIEIIDNKLYFYWPNVAVKGSDYQAMFDTVQSILKEIGKKLCQDDIFATKSQARVMTSSDSTRLKPKFQLQFTSLLLSFGCAALIIMARNVFNLNQSVWIFILYGVVLTGTLVFAVIKSTRRNYLRRDLQKRYRA